MLTAEQKAIFSLSFIEGLGTVGARALMRTMGSAEALFAMLPEQWREELQLRPALMKALEEKRYLDKVEEELRHLSQHPHIQTLFSCDEGYPPLLKTCVDAPLLFYCMGDSSLFSQGIGPWISIVGSRTCTAYGEEAVEAIVSRLATLRPDAVLVSGLAYGIDVHAHRAALKHGLRTVAVLAHGFHTLYPAAHRQEAEQILRQGGALITEYPYSRKAFKHAFLERNRIIAGLSAATIVVESADRGGSLATADMAFSYGRSVYAVPGRISDISSLGCNNLIVRNKATLFSSVDALLEDLEPEAEQSKSSMLFSPSLFDEVPPELLESPYYRLLQKYDTLQIEDIALKLGKSLDTVSGELFVMELDGYVKSLPGGNYCLEMKYKQRR